MTPLAASPGRRPVEGESVSRVFLAPPTPEQLALSAGSRIAFTSQDGRSRLRADRRQGVHAGDPASCWRGRPRQERRRRSRSTLRRPGGGEL